MAENFNYCHVVGKTDVGRKRAANEDNMYNLVTQNGLVSIVCDGMGGHVGGATASRIAVSTIAEHLTEVYYDDPRIAIGESIDKANQAVLRKTEEQPELKGMGSTCVLLLVRDGKVYIGHVGDSRIYLVRSKKIIQLTKDHSFVQMLVDCGEITKEQAEHHPRKNEITNALGIPGMTPATVAQDAIIPEAGDCFVLCSDGLSGMVSDDRICKVIGRQAEMTAQERVDRLVDMANENGGVDNITIQLVEFSVAPGAVVSDKKFPLWAKVACAAAVLGGLVVGGYFIFKDKKEDKQDEGDLGGTTELVVEKENIILPGDPLVFKEGEDIVEFEFSDSVFIQKRPGYEPFTQGNIQIDPSSLVVETEGVTVEYNNSLLKFTDKAPANSVVTYSFSSPDKKKLYVYTIEIKVPGGAPALDPSGLKSFGRDGADGEGEGAGAGAGAGAGEGEGAGIEDATPVADDTEVITLEPVNFEYDEIGRSATVIFNYSANPFVKFGSSEKRIETERIAEVLHDDPEFQSPESSWNVEVKTGRSLVVFKFEGGSASSYSFTIPCVAKDSKKRILVRVELVKREAVADEVVPEDETPEADAPVEEVLPDEEAAAEGSEDGAVGSDDESAAETGVIDNEGEQRKA